MIPTERFKLLQGPYYPPRFRLGGKVTVRRVSAGRILWPQTPTNVSLIVCGDLVRALQRGSATAICR